MTIATLKDVLVAANRDDYAVPGLVVLGWEDASAYVQAAEAEQAAIILQAGPGCRKHTPLPILGAMFRYLAERASVPVVCHLDHGYDIATCREAMDYGFTSVMYDGSKLPLAENIAISTEIVAAAHAAGVSVEGEVGFVGYNQGAASRATDPKEASRFARETGVDALAVSVGNMHLQENKEAMLDFAALQAIEQQTSLPLVLHGGSGLDAAQRQRVVRTSRVAKINIGTELRQQFGKTVRQLLQQQPQTFDRIAILQPTISPLIEATRRVIRELRGEEK